MADSGSGDSDSGDQPQGKTLFGFDRQIWILVLGRLLSAIGSGFTLFYAPIYFVNVVGLRATSVGAGLSAQGIAGIIGRILSGTFADSKFLKRKGTILLAALTMSAGAFIFSATTDFPIYLVGNVLMGLGIGFFWPPSEAFIADISRGAKLNEAYAMNRLADSIGLAIGVVSGGLLISIHGAYRLLFIVDGSSYLVLFIVVLAGIKESFQPTSGPPRHLMQGWRLVLADSRMRIYVLFNVLFTSFIAQVFTTLPLYFKNFVRYHDANGLPYPIVCSLFAGYILVMAIFQLPSARLLSRFKRSRVLMFACVLELLAFMSVWFAGASTDALFVLIAASASVALFALGNAVYNPVASALVVGLATAETRAVYLSANSLCWALGLCIGPVLGLAALDHSLQFSHALWLVLAASCLVAILILFLLEPKLPEKSLSG